MQHKTDFKIKAQNDAEMTFTGYANVKNIIDHANEMAMDGAFEKTVSKANSTGKFPKLLAQHGHTSAPIGIITSMKEDSHGLLISGKFADTVAGNEYFSLVKMGAIDAFSIGYKTITEQANRQGGYNMLQEIDVKEISLVTFACNEESLVTEVKSATSDLQTKKLQFNYTPEQDQNMKTLNQNLKAVALKAVASGAVQELDSNIKVKASAVLDTKSLLIAGDGSVGIDSELLSRTIERARKSHVSLNACEQRVMTSTKYKHVIEVDNSAIGDQLESDGTWTPFAQTATSTFISTTGNFITKNAKALISNESLKDPVFDVSEVHERQIVKESNIEYGRQLWYGNGTTEMSGLAVLKGAGNGCNYDPVESIKDVYDRPFDIVGAVNTGLAGNLTAPTVKAFTNKMIGSIAGDYITSAVWTMNLATYEAFRNFVHADSHTALNFDAVNGELGMEGFPVRIDENFQDISDSEHFITFGSMEEAVLIGSVPDLTTMNPYAADGALTITTALRKAKYIKDLRALVLGFAIV